MADSQATDDEVARNRRWTELSGRSVYHLKSSEWVEVKQHVDWLYNQLKLARRTDDVPAEGK